MWKLFALNPHFNCFQIHSASCFFLPFGRRLPGKHVLPVGPQAKLFSCRKLSQVKMPVAKGRPFSYCYCRGIYSKMARFYSVGPRISTTKQMLKTRKKTLLKDMGVRAELTQLLNARLSQLKGSSDEFHVLWTAHHEGSFEDRWTQSGGGGFFERPNIIERFSEVVPPNDMTPAFVEKLMATQVRVSDLIKDNHQLWLDDVKSFSKQMKRASPKENANVSLDKPSASSFAKSDLEQKKPESSQATSVPAPRLLQRQSKKKAPPPPQREDKQAEIQSEKETTTEPETLVKRNKKVGLVSELNTTYQANQDTPSDETSFYVDDSNGVKPTSILKGTTKATYKKPVAKGQDVPKTKRDTEKLNTFFNNDLEAYINACIFTGMIDKAMSTLKFYSCIHLQSPGDPIYHVSNISIYSSLMHAAAKKGKFGPLQDLFQQITKNGLAPSLQCYAACLECLARQDVMDIELGQHIISDLRRDGFREEDIFNACIFRRDERQHVLKALKTLNSHFEPRRSESETSYRGHLLEKLNYPLPPDQMVEANPYVSVVDNECLLQQMEKQQNKEQQDNIKIKSIVRQTVDKPQINENATNFLDIWKKTLHEGFNRKLSFYEKQKRFDNRMSLYPYMKLFSPDVYVNIMLEEATKLATDSETFSPSLGFLWQRMGSRIYYKYLIEDKINSLVAKKMNRLYRDYIELYNDPNLETLNYRLLWQQLQIKHIDGPTLDVPNKYWPVHVVKGIGRILFDIILYDLKINNSNVKDQTHHLIPAFYTVYRNYSYMTKEEVKPHPKTMKLFQASMSSELTFDAVALPMLIPPVPWISVNIGSNLLASTKLIRLPESVSKTNSSTILPDRSLGAVFDGLNALSACPWIINKPVLDLIINVFNNKGNKKLDIPPPAAECPPLPKITHDMNGHQRSRTQRMRVKLKQQKAEMHSLWCNELYKLSIANHFRDDVFWFPHNMDFRGRTYPCPPHFNHLGSDVTRSILLFAKGQKLGPWGLDWLKIHLINLTGFKKRSSNAERLVFANENMDNILNSADHPMEGRCWWHTSDEPWQTLACCMEIAKAVRSPDPAEYVSHFPVHQDGSCNGLQHYAALGRDQAGAESVNLSPSDQPQDVYSDVCELVECERAKDAKNGILIAQKLEGFVKRKIIKQTVMTTVYGVTRYGAKYQILKQLKDLQDFDPEHVWPACVYLADKTFLCLAEMFSATKEIQMWLTFCAHHISTLSLRPVEWITPLGLPVIQPYHKMSTLQRWGVSLTNSMSNFEKPNSLKQKNAFPPNFIHSLDSTHMLLTALYCLREGITYVSVHDCFWTHPASVEIMNKICREQFVALHNQPILEDLSEHLLKKFCTTSKGSSLQEVPNQRILRSMLSKVPKKGTFNLEEILNSTYFFS